MNGNGKSGEWKWKYGKLWAKVKVKGDEEQQAFNEFLLLFLAFNASSYA